MTLLKYSYWLLNISRDAGDKHFNPKTQLCLIPRDTVWYAISLLFDASQEKRSLGVSLLEKIRSEDGTHTPATMLATYHNIPELLTPSAKENLFQNIKRELVHSAEIEWNDGNVNHPLGAWCTLICGGELCHEPWATELGYRKLKTFRRTIGDRRHRFRRQAEMSEYNSLTYTALDLWFLAIIAEHARHPEAKKLALFLEQRLWIDVAMHYHAPSQQFAGPHSRSYQTDSTGGFSALHCTMLAAFGDELYLNPYLATAHNHASDLIENSLIAILKFHVPDLARKIAWKKPFPYYFQMTTYGEQYHENGKRWNGHIPQREIYPHESSRTDQEDEAMPSAFDDEVYPGGWSDLTTFMTQEYALGTVSTPYVNAGHVDSMMLRMRRSEKINSMSDFRSMYTRGVFNDAVIGQSNFCHVTQSTIDESYLYEEGRCATYQHRNTAIVCYAPKRAGHLRVRNFRLDLIFGYFAPFDEFRVDEEVIEDFPAMIRSQSRIYFRDYQTYGVIIPLQPSPTVRETPIKIWIANNHLMISIFNYNGEEKNLTREEINRWRTGFVIELATREEFTAFEDFISYAKRCSVTENVGDDAVRRIFYANEHHRMEMIYDPFREIILSRQWDGKQESIDHLYVEANGLTDGEFCPKTIFGIEALQSPPL